MYAYQYAFHIERLEADKRLQLAIDLLTNMESVVVIDDSVALHPDSQGITCAVILGGLAEPQSQVENAKLLLNASSIGPFVQSRPQQWIAVEDYGMGARQIWPPLHSKNSIE